MHKFWITPLLILLSAGCSSSQSNLEKKVHKMCLKANDYEGCVKQMKSSSIFTKGISKGNKCPEETAYIGNGKCVVVKCTYNSLWWGIQGPNDPLLVGKSDWDCPFSPWGGPGRLKIGQEVSITKSSDCPAGEPAVGWNSTCEAPYIVKIKKTNKKPMACRNGVWDENHPKCRDAGITSSMDMD